MSEQHFHSWTEFHNAGHPGYAIELGPCPVCTSEKTLQLPVTETPLTIYQWQLNTFGEGTPLRYAIRANEEMAELLSKLVSTTTTIGEIEAEIADVFIVLCGCAGVMKLNFQEAVDAKMAINRARRWRMNGDGTAQHEGDSESGK